MTAEEALRSNEDAALGYSEENQIIADVRGKGVESRGASKRGFGAAASITAMIVLLAVFFSSENFFMPKAIAERIIEETDVQATDGFKSKVLVIQQTLFDGKIPNNTRKRFKENGILTGKCDNGFEEVEKSETELCLKVDDKIVMAQDLPTEAEINTKLYSGIEKSTFSRAAYWHDKAAQSVFRKMGISRNNFTGDESFEEVMTKIMGEGSDLEINSVGLYEKKNQENGKIYYEYNELGGNVKSDLSAEVLVEDVRNKSVGVNVGQATLEAASNLNVADTVVKEQNSSKFTAVILESINKMQAGYGNESRIDEVMDYLHTSVDTEVVDVKTGEMVTVSGSMLESPSLYAILSDEKVDVENVENYSSDRVLKTIEKQLRVADSGGVIGNVVASTARGKKGFIGKLISWGEAAASEILAKITPTVKSSLVENSFASIKGVPGGEFLVEGAVNIGKELAKQSGATGGDAEAIKSYARLNNSVLALEAESERLQKSPFDITSRHTFLGSIVYNLAVTTIKGSSYFKNFASFVGTSVKTFAKLFPSVYADDGENGFLTNFGNCETLGNIGAMGSSGCTMVATFDTSTLNNTFNDPGFVSFVERNTVLQNGVRTIKNDSALADFIIYNNERVTPTGVMDGGILESLNNKSNSIPLVSDILGMVKTWLDADDKEKRLASGEAFVNSAANPDWQTYKYAQRYVSLARAQDILRQYDGDVAAYSEIKFFEGRENPVIAFLQEYYASLR